MGKTGSSFRADQAPRPHLTPLANARGVKCNVIDEPKAALS